jgi:hypothetical protein
MPLEFAPAAEKTHVTSGGQLVCVSYSGRPNGCQTIKPVAKLSPLVRCSD